MPLWLSSLKHLKNILENDDIEYFRDLFWTILNHVTTFDEKEWPEDIPSDPSHINGKFVLTESLTLLSVLHLLMLYARAAIFHAC